MPGGLSGKPLAEDGAALALVVIDGGADDLAVVLGTAFATKGACGFGLVFAAGAFAAGLGVPSHLLDGKNAP